MPRLKVTKIAHFSGHRDCIYALGLSAHEHRFYSGASEGFIVEWNALEKGDGRLIANVGKPVYSLLADTGKDQLLCGTADGHLHVIDLEANKETRNIEAHTLGLFDMQFAGDLLITAGGDGIVCVWNKQDLSLVHRMRDSEKSARVIAVNPAKQELVVGFSDWMIRVYDLSTFALKRTLASHTNSVFALCYAPGGNLFSGGRDAMLKVWNEHGQLIHDIPAHTLQIKHIAFNPSGTLFATVSMDKTIKIWSAENYELLKVIDKARNDAHVNSINKLLWLNDSELLTCSDDRTVMMWKLIEN